MEEMFVCFSAVVKTTMSEWDSIKENGAAQWQYNINAMRMIVMRISMSVCHTSDGIC